MPGMLPWSSKITTIFIVNHKNSLVFETTNCSIELQMKNHCGESVGFSFRAAQCGFGSDFQVHPATVFCKISIRKSKHGLEFSVGLGRLKISRCPFHSCTIFEACLINLLRFSELYFFTFHSPCWAIFQRKTKPKIFGLKNVRNRERIIEKFSLS